MGVMGKHVAEAERIGEMYEDLKGLWRDLERDEPNVDRAFDELQRIEDWTMESEDAQHHDRGDIDFAQGLAHEARNAHKGLSASLKKLEDMVDSLAEKHDLIYDGAENWMAILREAENLHNRGMQMARALGGRFDAITSNLRSVPHQITR